MRVTKYFKLDRDQSTVDFFDIDVKKDSAVFVDPAAIRSLNTDWGHRCTSLLQAYFEKVLEAIRSGDVAKANDLLSCLNERNEFHLGFTQGTKSEGRALGPVSAERIRKSMTTSKAATTGLLQDLEDSVLFVEGVGPDLISDAVCNILRGPLIEYTQHMCRYYGIPMKADVPSGPLWHPITGRWKDDWVELPVTNAGKLIFVPKVIVRTSPTFDAAEYRQHYLMPYMQELEKSMNSALVETLKSGKKRVTKKALAEHYGTGKLAAAELTYKHPDAFASYKAKKRADPTTPLGHNSLAEIENIPLLDFDALVADVLAIPTGQADAGRYENAIEKLLSAVFYPVLVQPEKQYKIHGGMKRIDITYFNSSLSGFFRWVADHYPAGRIFVECKNYGAEVGNPEVDQLSTRFSPSRGQVGLLVVRKVDNLARLHKRCKNASKDGHGHILVLQDSDLPTLVRDRTKIISSISSNILRKQFEALTN